MMKKITVTTLGALCGYLVYSFLTYGHIGEEVFTLSVVIEYSLFIVIGVMSAWGIVSSNHYLNKWLPWKRGILVRLLAGYIAQLVLIMSLILVITGTALYIKYGGVIPADLIEVYAVDFIKLCIIILLGVMVYNVIYFASFSYNEFTVIQIQTLESERRQLQLQLEALKSQLKPHYLFNSLNTISSLLYKDAKLTEHFIRRLAETYKYILSTHQQQYVTLAEEIEFVKSYHFLLKVRFEENIYLEINIPPTLLKTKIPPLTMQILVENAIKHNVITSDKPLYIYMSAQDDTILKVVNTKSESPMHTTSFNIGLKNIKKRYTMLSDDEIKVIDEQKFAVHLPVIKKLHPISA
jgi:hypothetical protein